MGKIVDGEVDGTNAGGPVYAERRLQEGEDDRRCGRSLECHDALEVLVDVLYALRSATAVDGDEGQADTSDEEGDGCGRSGEAEGSSYRHRLCPCDE